MENLRKNFRVFFFVVGVVAAWRGIWGLLDLYLFPGNENLSFILSIIIGVGILYHHGNKINDLV